MNIQNAQRAGFNSFDPQVGQGNSWDPQLAGKWNGADGTGAAGQTVVAAKPGQKMQISLTLANPSAGLLNFELFNYLNSMTRVRNTAYVVGAYAYIPLISFEGFAAQIAGTDGCVGFNQAGDLEIHAAAAAVKGSIGCSEIAYVGLFEASHVIPFNINYFRYTVTTDAQIDKTITYFQKSFSGGVQQNVINPRSFFLPNQFQAKVLDVNVEFAIGQDTGLLVQLLAGETVKLALFINAWGTQALIGG